LGFAFGISRSAPAPGLLKGHVTSDDARDPRPCQPSQGTLPGPVFGPHPLARHVRMIACPVRTTPVSPPSRGSPWADPARPCPPRPQLS
jgi:hypothetical protein